MATAAAALNLPPTCSTSRVGVWTVRSILWKTLFQKLDVDDEFEDNVEDGEEFADDETDWLHEDLLAFRARFTCRLSSGNRGLSMTSVLLIPLSSMASCTGWSN